MRSPTRRELLAATLGAAAVGSAGTRAGSARPREEWGPEAWPTLGRDAAHTGYDPNGEVPADVEVEWSADAGSDRGFTAPVVGDAGPSVGTTAFAAARDGVVCAFDPGSGDRRWRFDAGSPVETAPALDVGEERSGSGTLVVGTAEGVVGVDAADGTEEWRFETGGDARPSPEVLRGRTYFVADGAVYARDATGGEGHWRAAVGAGDGTRPAVVGPEGPVTVPVGDDPVVFVAGEEGSVYALDGTDGGRRWRFDAGTAPTSPAVMDLPGGPAVVVGTAGGDVYAVDAREGRERWRYALGERVERIPAVKTGPNPTVYAQGHQESRLHAIDATEGTERWRYVTDADVYARPAVVGDVAVFGDRDGTLYAIDALSGTERWRWAGREADHWPTTPAVVDGTVYVGTDHPDGGRLYALGGTGSSLPSISDVGIAVSVGLSVAGLVGSGAYLLWTMVDSRDRGDDGDGQEVPDPDWAADWEAADDRGEESGTDAASNDDPGDIDRHDFGDIDYPDWSPGVGTGDADRSAGTGRSSVEDDPGSGWSTGVPSGGGSGDRGSSGPPPRIPPSPGDAGEVQYRDVDRTGWIGAGANASVYAAEVRGRPVAVKEPDVEADLAVEEWDRVDDHPHVLGVLDWGETPTDWVAMERAGGSLADPVGRLDTDRALWTTAAVADAVAHAHDVGVTHLALSPANVLLRDAGEGWPAPKVGDWGVASPLAEEGRGRNEVAPQYAAPEQLGEGFGTPGRATDVYALGAVCYELVTGQAPFTGRPHVTPAPDRVVRRTLEETPIPPSELVDGLPPDLDDLLLTALARDRAGRVDDVEHFRARVEDLYGSVRE